jgi:hypothetical protein
MIVGTSSELPGKGFDSPSSIDVSAVNSLYPYQGYMLNDTYVSSIFSNVPSGLNSWRWTVCEGDFSFLFGADLNAVNGGDPSDPYAVIEICKQATTDIPVPYIYVDDISIVIY